jgi:hypothetical protein
MPECNKDKETMIACFDVVTILPLLRSRFLVVESQYD